MLDFPAEILVVADEYDACATVVVTILSAFFREFDDDVAHGRCAAFADALLHGGRCADRYLVARFIIIERTQQCTEDILVRHGHGAHDVADFRELWQRPRVPFRLCE